jgi:hypothetical protein
MGGDNAIQSNWYARRKVGKKMLQAFTFQVTAR